MLRNVCDALPSLRQSAGETSLRDIRRVALERDNHHHWPVRARVHGNPACSQASPRAYTLKDGADAATSAVDGDDGQPEREASAACALERAI